MLKWFFFLKSKIIDTLETLEQLEIHIWNMLTRAKVDRKHPFRIFVLGTITASGIPDARNVILRNVHQSNKTLCIYTDARTPKVNQLLSQPNACLVFYNPKSKEQLRVRATASVLINEQRNLEIWNALPKHAKKDYQSIMAPGTAKEASNIYIDAEDSSNFCLIEFDVLEIDFLELNRKGHRRASFKYGHPSVQATWLVP